jgi:hypothetical protein
MKSATAAPASRQHRAVSAIEPVQTPLSVVCFGGRNVEFDDALRAALEGCDLVLALGDLDLVRLAEAIGESKPALCVLGDRDLRRPPPSPFTPLHGSGVVFRGWRIVGLSGGRHDDPGEGFSLDEAEATETLASAPGCDILISHLAPGGLGLASPSLAAVGEYVLAANPLYHFCVSEVGTTAALLGETLVVAVDGALIAPPLEIAG